MVCLVLLTSCSAEDKTEISDAVDFDLKRSQFEQLDGWREENLEDFAPALNGVCDYIKIKKISYLKSNRFSYSLSDYHRHCAVMKDIKNPTELKKYIESNFVPYLVVSKGNDEGKFTSYYEANIRASLVKDAKYRYPIYGKPNDLVEVNLRDFDRNLPNKRLVGRVKDGKLIKYYTREEIDKGVLDAPVILWGDDPVDIYIMQIQGSAIATLPDGKEVRVGYAENNGHSFRGIGSILIEKGLIKPKDSSMPKVREWLRNNGDAAHKNMLLNNRFIFHKIVKADGPIGAMGLPLVAGRSIAIDKKYIPLGSMVWLETSSPDGKKIHKMVMAEDVGSAIKGAVRGDYFWGHGEDALHYAGRMNSSGRYFILLPRNTGVDFYER